MDRALTIKHIYLQQIILEDKADDERNIQVAVLKTTRFDSIRPLDIVLLNTSSGNSQPFNIIYQEDEPPILEPKAFPDSPLVFDTNYENRVVTIHYIEPWMFDAGFLFIITFPAGFIESVIDIQDGQTTQEIDYSIGGNEEGLFLYLFNHAEVDCRIRLRLELNVPRFDAKISSIGTVPRTSVDQMIESFLRDHQETARLLSNFVRFVKLGSS